MTINIALSSPGAKDWLARMGEEEKVEIWAEMNNDERERRSNEALAKALATYLTEVTDEEEVTTAEAKVILVQFNKKELREATRAAINRDSDGDHLDRMSEEIVERLGDKTPV